MKRAIPAAAFSTLSVQVPDPRHPRRTSRRTPNHNLERRTHALHCTPRDLATGSCARSLWGRDIRLTKRLRPHSGITRCGAQITKHHKSVRCAHVKVFLTDGLAPSTSLPTDPSVVINLQNIWGLM